MTVCALENQSLAKLNVTKEHEFWLIAENVYFLKFLMLQISSTDLQTPAPPPKEKDTYKNINLFFNYLSPCFARIGTQHG